MDVADVYVFCLYPERDEDRADVLDTPAWQFYVVATEVLNRELPDAKSVSLTKIAEVNESVQVWIVEGDVDS